MPACSEEVDVGRMMVWNVCTNLAVRGRPVLAVDNKDMLMVLVIGSDIE